MNILITATLLIILYVRTRNLYITRITCEYRYKLFQLRDKLRQHAIDGKVNPHKSSFNYLDTTISKTVSELEYTNLYTIILLNIYHKNDLKSSQSARTQLQKEINNNSGLKEIEEIYISLIKDYLIKRHFVIRISLLMGIFSLLLTLGFIRKIKKFFKRTIDGVLYYPETSTITTYKIAH